MGSESRFEYSAVGDPVNCAARYESATKGLGVDLVIGQAAKDGIFGLGEGVQDFVDNQIDKLGIIGDLTGGGDFLA